MKYKLIAIDVDGTLIDSEGKIPAVNVEAIQKAREKGVNVIISSGRSAKTFRAYRDELDLLGDNSFASALNGGTILKGDEIIRKEKLGRLDALKIIEELRKLPKANEYIRVYGTPSVSMIEKENDYTKFYDAYTGSQPQIVKCFEDMITGDVFKVVLFCREEDALEAAEIMRDKKPDGINMVFSSKYLLEFTSREANKGAALKYISSLCGIPLSETAAIGDSQNDVSMLETAGFSASPANADVLAKCAAKYITSASNNDGAVAEVINKFIL